MPRGRRQHDELSEAFWRRMLMGPRPPSVQWPPAKKGNGKGKGQSADVRPSSPQSAGLISQLKRLQVASTLPIGERLECVSEIRETSPKTTCSGRGSSEEGCRDSVQVRGGTSRGARQIEAFAGGGSSITHEFNACRPSRRSGCIAEAHFGTRRGSTIESAWPRKRKSCLPQSMLRQQRKSTSCGSQCRSCRESGIF